MTATAEQRAAKVTEVMGAADAQARLQAGMAHVMRPEQVLRDEARTKHQRRLALAFVRKIDKICKESGAGGDPIVIAGAGGSGTGRRGRAQCKHKVMLNALAGFFTVIMLDEHCTSKKTTCCHQDAHAPRSKGRSRGCKNKDCPAARRQAAMVGSRHGGGLVSVAFSCLSRFFSCSDDARLSRRNMLSVFISLLLTGERPIAMTKAARTSQ